MYFVETIQSKFFLLLITTLFCAACGTKYEITTASMEPTLRSGQSVTTESIPPEQLERGDIILYKDPSGEQLHIKRLIGLPLETVEIIDDKVFINAQPLNEEYETIPNTAGVYVGPLILAEGEYFVLGDNRPASFDSRQFGALDADKILGRIILPE